MNTALIFGITGQDGSYLADLLLEKGYKVYGVSRRVSVPTDLRIKHLEKNTFFDIIQGDITDQSSVARIIKLTEPQEIYNLAAQSHVGISFNEPCHTWDVTGKGCLNILEGIRNSSNLLLAKFYQASSSEMFGSSFTDTNGRRFQFENTLFMPQSPYAVAKLAAHHLTRLYRYSYKLFACSGILFNHESPRRGENFVTRKITKYIGSLIAHGDKIGKLKLGNINSYRDWGHAKDYVYAMWLMLQHDKPDDYVVSTGETHSVKDFLEKAFNCVKLSWTDFVEIDENLYRPAEVDYLRGDSSKARNILNWSPKYSFDDLVKEMVMNDVEQERLSNGGKRLE